MAKEASVIKKDVLEKRKSFNKFAQSVEAPNLISHQLNSFKDFVQNGLAEVIGEITPIDDYTGGKLRLNFTDYEFGEPEVSEFEARENGKTFEVALHIDTELINKATGESKTAKIFMGNYPWMTERGTFVINGSERVVISQLSRSAGVIFSRIVKGDGRAIYSAKVSPVRGAWIEIETTIAGVMYIKIDKKRKIPITTFLVALGITDHAGLKQLFKEDEANAPFSIIEKTLEKDITKNEQDALVEVFRKLRPGELVTVENARYLIDALLFNFKRYDLGRVGRHKLNRRLGLNIANDVDGRVLNKADVVAIVRELLRLSMNNLPADDIDSLSNRRIKMVGELLAKQFRTGFLRMERNIRDKMSLADLQTVSPQLLINARPLVSVVREFFTTGQMSQYMEQTNPLRELSHKRRITSMGPGGLTRERAGFEVRDSHPTQYGRICPVETPEGPNIGLVLNLATYAKVNEFGFIEAPYYKVKDGKVTKDVEYLDVEAEAGMIIASGGTKVDENGRISDEVVVARENFLPVEVEVDKITHIDANSGMILGVPASAVPFAESDDAKRVLMASNMQKQAVPLIKKCSPRVGTGIEGLIARNTGQMIVAEEDGKVLKADSIELIVEYKGSKDPVKYNLEHFKQTNDGMCINQQVVVRAGETIKKDQVLIEGMSIKDGELALGKDVLVAFMNHGGYNFEDSIILSRRLVQDDEFTSIHIIESNIDIRDTKLGPEQITRDVPNVGEDMLRNLDADGIVAIGSEVGPGDILVGKITPKGETELTGEARLLRAIFGDNAKEVRDTSLRVKNDEGGKVVGVKIFSRENGHDLRSGTLMHVQILIARMQKAEVGDKFAGRHGNKGCIAKIMAIEDMPFTEDGRPVDVILNPLGIGARMNMGQVFEVHLGLAAEALGYKAQTPVFDRIKSEQIAEELQKAGFNRDGKVQLIDGRTGELFKDRVAIGIMHMIKLEHMASNKVHARSTGPYAMITQQPLGGKAQNGGQRFGEMEVWALEAHGAANTLQEMLTIKSDDVLGRGKAYESLVKQQPIVGARYPESFKVLSNELRGLGLEIELVEKEGDEYEVDDDMNSKDVMRPDDLDQNAIDKELAAMNSEVSDEHAPKEVVDTDLEKEITEEGEDA